MNLPDILSFHDVKERIRESLAEDLGPNKLDLLPPRDLGPDDVAVSSSSESHVGPVAQTGVDPDVVGLSESQES
jgi:hypothetical protein